MFRTVFLFFFVFTAVVYANDKMNEAEAYFQNEEYTKAYAIYKEYTSNIDSPEAAYKLGWMYENGKGVEVDPEKAIYWYKKAAKWNLSKSNMEKIYETLYSNLDPLDSEESTNTLVQMANGKFGLRAYYPNYWVVSYTDKIPNGDPTLQDPTIDGTHYIQTETKFQISVRADYLIKWFGFRQMWTGAYTQTSYWQLFIESSPFRETNYKPELFVTFPFYHKLDAIGMKAISFGYKHSSNGQPDSNSTVRVREDGPYEGSRSRSWNRLYVRSYFQWENIFAELTIWHRMKEDYATNDNPDITDFYGQGSLELGYIREKLLTRVTMRQSFKSGNFSGELEMSHPLPLSDNVFFYLQACTGYGQSLIDYDKHVDQIGFGFSISR